MPALNEQNLLAAESSPYLRQHADNPVHWCPWSIEALEEARAHDRPILLSIGYSACHWCHVMAHESFEDRGVADVMNRLFVNIKVDREERPDIDQIYMAALTAMGEQGGWPLTIFLTPDAQPFWGGTYFPREPRYGRPGFIQVLEAVGRTWSEKREDLARSAKALSDHVHNRLAPASIAQILDSSQFHQQCDAIAAAIDPIKGGLKGAPKFPNAPFMNLLWLNWLTTGNTVHRDLVLHSLRNMLEGGIYDHLGGGLCRYSTDVDWLVPHFEKMLYDNTHLIELCCHAYGETGDPLFRSRIDETITWLEREMMLTNGAFASSLDADSDGEEGRFYLWTSEEILSVLGNEEAAHFLKTYRLSKPDGWHGDPVLHLAPGTEGLAPELARMRQRLFLQRATRMRPTRDDKILTDWNGQLISALTMAGRQFHREDWVNLAYRAFHFISQVQTDGRLPHVVSESGSQFPGMATDYAAMISAAVSLWQASGDDRLLKQARHWSQTLDRWYIDEFATGYYLTASDAKDVPLRLRGDIDEAVPSATAQILLALQKVATATGDMDISEKLHVLAMNALGRAEHQGYGQAALISAAEIIQEPMKLVIVDKRHGDFVAEANRIQDPRRIDVILTLGQPGESATLADGTVISTGRSGAWLCCGAVCLPPVFDARALAKLLRQRG